MSAKFAFIDAEKAQYSIVKMCAWMGVSTSGFYEWRDRPTSATGRRRARLATLIEWIFNDSDHTYGHRRIHAALHRQGERVTPELVRSIMRERGLTPCQPRPFRPTTTVAGDSSATPGPARPQLPRRRSRHQARRVGWPGGIAPPGSHRTVRDSLPSHGSYHPVGKNSFIHIQCANSRESRAVTPFHHTSARLKACNRLNFFRAHRIR